MHKAVGREKIIDSLVCCYAVVPERDVEKDDRPELSAVLDEGQRENQLQAALDEQVAAEGVGVVDEDFGSGCARDAIIGGVDLFVSEDIDYARRLNEAGVPTELQVIPGAYHGFDQLSADSPQARQFTRAKIDALRRAFARPAK